MRATSFELIAVLLACACGVFTVGPTLEQDGLRECSDGLDNDRDGKIDFPADPGCESEADPREERVLTPRACSDGIDNDGDGRIDFDTNGNGVRDAEDDPGCSSAADDDEYNVQLPQCNDGVDNDSDGKIDFPADPECSGRNDDSEAN
jgi:hypothetical protein